jgi:hypothetical protein
MATAAPPLVTVIQADAYFAPGPRAAEWTKLTDPQKDSALTEAQRWMETLCVDPDRTGCCGVFADRWTMAVSEVALALHLSPTAIITGAPAAGGATGEVKRQKLGDLEIEYFQASAGGAVVQTSRYGPKANPLLRAFPWLGDIIGCWITGGTGSSVIARYRS